MQKLAIDIVLLPLENISNKIIELNHSLKREYKNPRIILRENCLPHISLLMGLLQQRYLPQVKATLNYISQTFKQIDLEIISLNSEDLPAKDRTLKITGLALKKSQDLRVLHESLIKKIKRCLSDLEPTKEMFYNPEEIDIEDTLWMFPYVRNFIKNSSYNKFNPHITIGDGILEKRLAFPTTFKASRLALCHLGNYCTCRKVLYEKTLKP